MNARPSARDGSPRHACAHPGTLPGGVSARAIERAASLFRACGDPARLRLLEVLAHGERCVSDLAAGSSEGLSTVSQRLRLLRAEGLVSRRRDGKHIYYGLADDHVRALIESALDHASHDLASDGHAAHEDRTTDGDPR